MSSKVGVRITIPYLQGAYLAFNAVPDLYFLGDGPSCIFAKAEQIHGRHDLNSTLLSCDSQHRVQHTGVNVFTMAGDCEAQIVSALKRLAAAPGCGAVFLGGMPMCTIAGTDYARILHTALAGGKKPSFVLAPPPGGGDWLDGYAAVLEALAAGIDFGKPKPSPRKVALVGYLMDRNEGEHRGNLAELTRMLRAVGLDPVSIWLSGRPYKELREARRAGAVITLPHGRAAGRTLAKRLGARLVEAELPFGLEASRRFMETLGREFGREAEAAKFIASELDAAAPRLAWAVPHAFMNRRFAFAGDPLYAAGFVEQVESLGGRIAALLLMANARHLSAAQRAELSRRPTTAFEPLPSAVEPLWSALARGGADLIVGNGFAFRELKPGLKWLEFGFPSECTHFLHDEPFLGFRGALAFLSRVSNEVVRGLVLEAPDQLIAESSAAPKSAK